MLGEKSFFNERRWLSRFLLIKRILGFVLTYCSWFFSEGSHCCRVMLGRQFFDDVTVSETEGRTAAALSAEVSEEG